MPVSWEKQSAKGKVRHRVHKEKKKEKPLDKDEQVENVGAGKKRFGGQKQM